MPLCITNATDLLPRIALSVNEKYEEAEAGGQTFHPGHAGKYGYEAVTICSDDTDIFVMSLMFQYKISVPLIKQFGTKTMVRLIDLAKFVATTGI